jgi:formyl-CoA transferase
MTSAYFDSAYRSKESVELDLDDPLDRALALRMMSTADVVVENLALEPSPPRGWPRRPGNGQPGSRLLLDQRLRHGTWSGPAGLRFLVQTVGGSRASHATC